MSQGAVHCLAVLRELLLQTYLGDVRRIVFQREIDLGKVRQLVVLESGLRSLLKIPKPRTRES